MVFNIYTITFILSYGLLAVLLRLHWPEILNLYNIARRLHAYINFTWSFIFFVICLYGFYRRAEVFRQQTHYKKTKLL